LAPLLSSDGDRRGKIRRSPGTSVPTEADNTIAQVNPVKLVEITCIQLLS